jgi:hypothetical protein
MVPDPTVYFHEMSAPCANPGAAIRTAAASQPTNPEAMAKRALRSMNMNFSFSNAAVFEAAMSAYFNL